LRPGHANYTYLKKYGVFDYRGGGRASGRETVTRVAAGAVAKKLLALFGVEVVAYMAQIAGIQVKERETLPSWETIREHPIFCPDEEEGEKMIAKLTEIQEEGDSIGGTVEVITSSLPVGLGDPIYEKLEANLGKAMLSIPASKGFELGSGFHGVNMKGSEHNDLFVRNEKGSVTLKTNFSGGTLGGISSGMPLHFRVAFKPASSIKRIQETLTTGAEPAQLKLGKEGRHDPCVAIRAVPVVKSMTELVLIDALLMNKYCKIDN
jgi:chorismate synthase